MGVNQSYLDDLNRYHEIRMIRAKKRTPAEKREMSVLKNRLARYTKYYKGRFGTSQEFLTMLEVSDMKKSMLYYKNDKHHKHTKEKWKNTDHETHSKIADHHKDKADNYDSEKRKTRNHFKRHELVDKIWEHEKIANHHSKLARNKKQAIKIGKRGGQIASDKGGKKTYLKKADTGSGHIIANPIPVLDITRFNMNDFHLPFNLNEDGTWTSGEAFKGDFPPMNDHTKVNYVIKASILLNGKKLKKGVGDAGLYDVFDLKDDNIKKHKAFDWSKYTGDQHGKLAQKQKNSVYHYDTIINELKSGEKVKGYTEKDIPELKKKMAKHEKIEKFHSIHSSNKMEPEHKEMADAFSRAIGQKPVTKIGPRGGKIVSEKGKKKTYAKKKIKKASLPPRPGAKLGRQADPEARRQEREQLKEKLGKKPKEENENMEKGRTKRFYTINIKTPISEYNKLKDKESKVKKSVIYTIDELYKAMGAGSRGGKVIGHTKSGKPIYASSKARAVTNKQTKGISDEHKAIVKKYKKRFEGNEGLHKEVNKHLDSHAKGEHNNAYSVASHGKTKIPVPNYHAKPTGKIGSGAPKSAVHDTFGWHDAKYGVGKKLLQDHKKANKKVDIHTSSDMIGHDDYMQHIPKGSTINFHHGTEGGPSSKRLNKVADKLTSAGHTVKHHGTESRPSFGDKPDKKPLKEYKGKTHVMKKSFFESELIKAKKLFDQDDMNLNDSGVLNPYVDATNPYDEPKDHPDKKKNKKVKKKFKKSNDNKKEELKPMLPKGFVSHTGVKWADQHVESYNNAQKDINAYIKDGKKVPENLLNNSHKLFNMFSDSTKKEKKSSVKIGKRGGKIASEKGSKKTYMKKSFRYIINLDKKES